MWSQSIGKTRQFGYVQKALAKILSGVHTHSVVLEQIQGRITWNSKVSHNERPAQGSDGNLLASRYIPRFTNHRSIYTLLNTEYISPE